MKYSVLNAVKACSLFAVTLLAACSQNIAPPKAASSSGAGVSIQTPLGVQATTPVAGLTGEYFDNVDFTGTKVTRVDATINSTWGTGAPITGIQPTTYSVQWTGQISAPSTETYTFFLTSDGAARLVINGQVVANDWTTHTTKTTTSTLSLVAGTKYDIRLEYARNTIQSSNLKLEWSSGARTRQVVPNTNLTSNVSNAGNVLSILQMEAKFKSLNIALNTSNIISAVDGKGNNAFFAFSQTSPDYFLGRLTANSLDGILQIQNKNGEIAITDLLTGRNLNLGSAIQYGSSVSQTTDQRMSLIKKIIVFLGEGYYKESDLSPKSIRSQDLILGFGCDLTGNLPNNFILPTPPSCLGGYCDGKAGDYRSSVCAEASVVESIIATAVGFRGGLPQGMADRYFAFSGPADVVRTLFTGWHTKKWKEYLDCLQTNRYPVTRASEPGKITGCVIGISTDDTKKEYFLPISRSSDITIIVKNDTGNVNIPANATLDGVGQTISASLGIGPIGNGEGFRLLPGGSYSFPGQVNCPSVPTDLTVTVGFVHNATHPKSSTVTVTIHCITPPKPKISDPTPNPLMISGTVGGPDAKGSFTFKNIGTPTPDGQYATLGFGVTSSDLSLSPNAGDLSGGAVATINASISCKVVGDFHYTAIISSNDPSGPKTVDVKVTCTQGNIQSDVMFATYGLTGDGGGAARIDVSNSSGQMLGYYYLSQGNVQVYGSGGTSYYHFRGGNGLFGIIYEKPYVCQTGISMDNIFYTDAARKEIRDCLDQNIANTLQSSIPSVEQAISQNRSVIPLYGGESVINLHVGQHPVFLNLGILGDVK